MADFKVQQRVEILDKRTAEVAVAKNKLDKARTSRTKAADSLKVARASLATIKKKKKAVPKPPAPKRITAQPKKGSAPMHQAVCSVCHKLAMETPVEKLECGCMFHLRCIQRWVKADKQGCPTCLAPDLFMKFRG